MLSLWSFSDPVVDFFRELINLFCQLSGCRQNNLTTRCISNCPRSFQSYHMSWPSCQLNRCSNFCLLNILRTYHLCRFKSWVLKPIFIFISTYLYDVVGKLVFIWMIWGYRVVFPWPNALWCSQTSSSSSDLQYPPVSLRASLAMCLCGVW